jgi:hypothetical protein
MRKASGARKAWAGLAQEVWANAASLNHHIDAMTSVLNEFKAQITHVQQLQHVHAHVCSASSAEVAHS